MNKTTQFLLATLAVCVVAIIILLMLISEDNKRIQSLQSTASSLTAELITRTNSEGKVIAEKQAAELRIKELEQINPKLVADLERTFDTKIKRFIAYMEVQFQARGSGQANVFRIPYDTTPYIDDTPFVYNPSDSTSNPYGFQIVTQDGYLDHRVNVNSLNDTPYEYTYSDSVKVAFIKHGKWYQKKTLYGSSVMSNPNATVLNSQSFLVKEYDDKRWGIGPYFGWGIDQELKPQFSIGISVNWDLIKF